MKLSLSIIDTHTHTVRFSEFSLLLATLTLPWPRKLHLPPFSSFLPRCVCVWQTLIIPLLPLRIPSCYFFSFVSSPPLRTYECSFLTIILCGCARALCSLKIPSIAACLFVCFGLALLFSSAWPAVWCAVVNPSLFCFFFLFVVHCSVLLCCFSITGALIFACGFFVFPLSLFSCRTSRLLDFFALLASLLDSD